MYKYFWIHNFDLQVSSCVPLLNATPPPMTTTETKPETVTSSTVDSTDDEKQDNNGTYNDL